jgi:hypothetical protein
MISYKGKPLEQLNFEETFEFEKELLRKSLVVHKATQNFQVQEQLHMYIGMVKNHRAELAQREALGLDNPDYEDKGMIIGEDEPEQPNDTE